MDISQKQTPNFYLHGVGTSTLLACFLLCSFPTLAHAGVMDELKKAWNEAMSYLDFNKAAGTTAEQCSKTLEKTEKQLSAEVNKISRQLNLGDLTSGDSVGDYEKRAAEAIQNLQQYQSELEYREALARSKKNPSLDAGGF